MLDKWMLYEMMAGGVSADADSRDDAIDESIRNLSDGIEGNPAYQADALVDGMSVPILADPSASHECNIKAMPGSDVHIGDVVECMGETWIVVELYKDQVGVFNGKMWMCNDIIKFQNGNSSVLEKPCVIDDGTYSKSTADRVAVAMDNTYKMYLPLDDDTCKLFVDKRLSFGVIYDDLGEQIMEVYKIIGIDLKSRNFGDGSHLMVVTLKRDVYNSETDSIIDMVCDLKSVADNSTSDSDSISMKITGPRTVRIGTTRKYSVALPEGVDCRLVWEIIGSNTVKCEFDGATCSVSIPFVYDLVGECFEIRARDETGICNDCALKVEVIGIG